MPQSDAFIEFTLMIVLHLGTWLLTPLTVIFYKLIMLSCDFNSKSRGPTMSIWLCLDGITTWHTMFKLHYNIIHTRDSSSQLYSSIQVYAIKYIKSNTQLHLPCYNTSPKKRFPLYIPTLQLSLKVHVHKRAQHISVGIAPKKFYLTLFSKANIH